MDSSIVGAIVISIIAGIFIAIQVAYLIYFKGRVNGVIKPLSKLKSKAWIDFLSITIISLVMGLPFMIYLLGSIFLTANDDFEAVYYILVSALHFLFLALLFWKMRKWRLTKVVKI